MKFSTNITTINNYKTLNNTTNIYLFFLNNFKKTYQFSEIKYLNKFSNFVYFLFKKEYKYTKLKYSRVPQADYVSGGVASLIAGLLGFLITEKVGFELIDSGDLFFLVMYVSLSLNTLRMIFKTLII